MLYPDRETLKRIPLSEFEINAVIADVYNGYQGDPYEDPRNVSQVFEDHLSVIKLHVRLGQKLNVLSSIKLFLITIAVILIPLVNYKTTTTTTTINNQITM